MEINKILSADLLDILFEGRNKSYGAYELRKSYSKRLILSLAVMLAIMLLLWGGFLLANNNKQLAGPPVFDTNDTVTIRVVDAKPDLPPLPPPPARAIPKMPEMKTIAFTTPQIVSQDVPESDKPPAMADMVDVKIGAVNSPNGVEGDFVAPPDGQGEGKGIIASPAAERGNPDSVFIKVEIDAQYPGGIPAWTRFLVKNLASSYPQEAIDQAIQGKVVIQFIVDREGNVSDIEAISGPKELWDAAIRVIKKSGKWIPAEQNGRKVKAYKRQPIIFQLEEQ
jgi:protein TonB